MSQNREKCLVLKFHSDSNRGQYLNSWHGPLSKHRGGKLARNFKLLFLICLLHRVPGEDSWPWFEKLLQGLDKYL